VAATLLESAFVLTLLFMITEPDLKSNIVLTSILSEETAVAISSKTFS
jgi:hypothetical protein